MTGVSASQGHSRPTILIVDGDDDTRAMLRFCFEEELGLTVREASSGAEALMAVRESLPNVVTMEMWLPGEIDGFETCRRLREDERTRFLPIVACTCQAMPKDIERARQAGCDAVLTKPFNPADVIATLRQTLQTEPVPPDRTGEIR